MTITLITGTFTGIGLQVAVQAVQAVQAGHTVVARCATSARPTPRVPRPSACE
ncbi:hypothetical protein [Lacisediminihabitans sp.]|uniref:hypothetical protein n=1 Tax=Lacisediminihabitans sp. TaxID=2787631 RepID=UPI002F930662